MLKFNNIWHGINYCVRCPICDNFLKISTKDKSSVINEWDFKYFVKNPNKKINFSLLGDNYLDYVSVGLKSDKIEVIINSNIGVQDPSLYNVKAFNSINCSCNEADCSLFEYTLQLELDLPSEKINVYLNSISVSLEQGDTLHEVKFNYSLNKTEYCKTVKNKTFKDNLPLLEFDRNIPNIVNKINKMILFL